jgi:hypothetical protein
MRFEACVVSVRQPIEQRLPVRDLAGCLEEAKRWRRGDSEIFNRDFIPRLTYVSRAGTVEE